MSDPNILISNGTCYSKAGEKLDGAFIPCGNDASGHKTCCGAGDNCLADNACFGVHGSGYGSLLTYVAGCSDPDYKDPSCPKKDIDQPWIGLTLCDNSDGVWAACSQEGNPSTLQAGSSCTCTDASKATVAFSDATSLTSICSLPKSAGESIQFFVGHIPTNSPSPGTTGGGASASASQTGGGSTPTATGSTVSGSSATGTAASSSSSGTPSDGGSDSGLSTGAKVGIGVGAAIGGLILLAAIVAFFLRRRKRQRSPPEIESASAGASDAKKSKYDSSSNQRVSAMSNASEVDGKAVSEVDGQAARPWSMRSELEGTPVVSNLGEHAEGGSVVGNAHGGRVRSGELSPVTELPAIEIPAQGGLPPQGVGHLHPQGAANIHPQGAGQVPAQVGGHKPAQGPSHNPVETTSQAPPHGGGLSVVGPEGAHFPGEQAAGNTAVPGAGNTVAPGTSNTVAPGTGNTVAPGTEHRQWGQEWREQ